MKQLLLLIVGLSFSPSLWAVDPPSPADSAKPETTTPVTPPVAPSLPVDAPAVPATVDCAKGVSNYGEIVRAHRAANAQMIGKEADGHFGQFMKILEAHDPARARLEIMDKVTGLIAQSRPKFDATEEGQQKIKDLAKAGKLGKETAAVVNKLRARTKLILAHQSEGILARYFSWVPFTLHPSVLWQSVQDRSRTVDDVLMDIDNTVATEQERTDEIKARHDVRMQIMADRERKCEEYAMVVQATADRVRKEIIPQVEDGSNEQRLFKILADTYDEEADRYMQVTTRWAESGQKGDALTLYMLKFKRILDTEALLAKASIEAGAISAEASGQLGVLKNLSKEYRKAANEADAAFSRDLLDTSNAYEELSRDHSADKLRVRAQQEFEKSMEISGRVDTRNIEDIARRRTELRDRLTQIRSSDVVIRVDAEEALQQSGLLDRSTPMIGPVRRSQPQATTPDQEEADPTN